MWNNFQKIIRSSASKSIINVNSSISTQRSIEKSLQCVRHKSHQKNGGISLYIKPIPIKSELFKSNGSPQRAKEIKNAELMKLMSKFSQDPGIKALCLENALDSKLVGCGYGSYEWKKCISNWILLIIFAARLQLDSFGSFRKFCLDSNNLSDELCAVIIDIQNGSRGLADLFPYFLSHVQQIFPYLSCLDDLQRISDLTTPANWYPDARRVNRKIVFHAGPTNSGKTYSAMKRFLEAESGVYCGPLKMLANEVFSKSNEKVRQAKYHPFCINNLMQDFPLRAPHVTW